MKSWIERLFGIKRMKLPKKSLYEKIENNLEGFAPLLEVIGRGNYSNYNTIRSVNRSTYFYGIVFNTGPIRISKEKNIYAGELCIPLNSELLKDKHVLRLPRVLTKDYFEIVTNSIEVENQFKNIIRQ